jgi:hypothetical protein
MGDEVTVVRDEIRRYDDDTVARVRVLQVPPSERFPEGLKYAFHYSAATGETPLVRFDNHHGTHELHIHGETYDIDFPGLTRLYEAWRAALPPAKRTDW